MTSLSSSTDFTFSPDPPGSVALGLTLLKQLDTKNAVISPGGLHLALRLAAAGTREGSESAKQLTKILGTGDGGTGISAKSSTMAMATAVFANSKIRAEYKAKAHDEFGALVSELPDSIEPINDWVRNATHGNISEVIGSLPQGADAILLSAVHFSAPWKTPFSKKNTVMGTFYANDVQETVQMMVLRNHSMHYAETNVGDRKVQVLSLPYDGDERFNAIIILPSKESNLDSVIDGLCESSDSSNWGKLVTSMKRTRMRQIVLPRFKLEWSGGMKENLAAMGLSAVFSGDAFPAMAENVAISDIVHKASLECTERGTEASAASAVIVGRSAARSLMVCDRPFLFAVTCGEDLSFICRVDNVANPN